MWTVQVVILGLLTLSAGNTVQTSFKGCFSTSTVEKYAFYYRINQSLPLEESFAVCNHRLTKYLGLQIDSSAPTYHIVFCGNDLLEVSPEVHSSRCQPCQKNTTLTCGGNDIMSVYLLRAYTPTALLVATDNGVEMLIDNTTTLQVAYQSDSDHKYVDYIYTEDMIVSARSNEILRSFYNPLTTKFSQYYSILSLTQHFNSLAADFVTNLIYQSYYTGASTDDIIYQTNTKTLQTIELSTNFYPPVQVFVDPYNRSLVYTYYRFSTYNIFSLDAKTHTKISLNEFQVDVFKALTMDIHNKMMYYILTLKGDNTTYLVRMDYGMSQWRILSSGPHLEGATVLEVFNDEAIWLRQAVDSSVIYKCKLTPICNSENVNIYKTTQKIYDFAIYHPEKQTPGIKRLCEKVNCEHGCKKFTPFSARCSCPPGLKMDPANNTCYAESTSRTKVTPLYDIEDATVSDDMLGVSSMETSTKDENVRRPEDGKPYSSSSFFEVFVTICNIVMLASLLVIGVLIWYLYRKIVQASYVPKQRKDVHDSDNEYVEIPMIKKM